MINLACCLRNICCLPLEQAILVRVIEPLVVATNFKFHFSLSEKKRPSLGASRLDFTYTRLLYCFRAFRAPVA